MPTTELSDLPRRLTLEVPVPQRLSSKAVNQTVAMAAARLRFLLGQAMRQQAHERVVARCAAKDAARARLEAAARRAVAEEAADVRVKARSATEGSVTRP